MSTNRSLFLLTLTILLLAVLKVQADIPVSCEYPGVYGEWTFQKTKTIYTKDVIYNQCSIDKKSLPQTQLETFNVALRVPDIALLKKNNRIIAKGRWTLIWNQGLEIRFPDYRYFAFFNYTLDDQGVATSHCDRVFVGTYHDNSVNSARWGCFTGRRVSVPRSAARYLEENQATNQPHVEAVESSPLDGRKYEDSRYVEHLNKAQSNWKASVNEHFKGKTIGELKQTYLKSLKKNSQSSRVFIEKEMAKKERAVHHGHGGQFMFNGKTDKYEWVSNDEISRIPTDFSWENIHGRDFLTPVRDQWYCGSCYAFGLSEMLGMRVRINSNLTKTNIFSPQAIVDCSPYSQGCSGGCVYLAAKYAQDYGLVLDQCLPYNETMEVAQTCTINGNTQCKKVRTSNYYNVGGYYGASNEVNMMMDILNNGPLVAGFMVYEDFFYYKSGIYTHVQEPTENTTDKKKNLPKFYYINHTLIIYGWGVDETTGQKYWKAQNSWGDWWGANGKVLVAKGDNTGFIESDAEAAIPIISNL